MPTTLHRDLACATCRYDLRGLDTDGKCPECGTPIITSLCDDAIARLPNHREWDDLIIRPALEGIARRSGQCAAAVLLVRAALRYIGYSADLAQRAPRHASAREVCRGLRRCTEVSFAGMDETLEILRHWNVTRSEDVGRIIWTMAEAGLVLASEHDHPSDYQDLFTLETRLEIPPDRRIPRDMACANCGHNLRGLRERDACPACGRAVLESIDAAPRTATHPDDQRLLAHRRAVLVPVAEEIGYPVEALLFVLDAVHHVRGPRRTLWQVLCRMPARSAAPADLCSAIRTYARVHFHDASAARHALAEWRLRDGHDIATIAAALVRHEYLHLPDMPVWSAPSAFDNLFSLDQLW